MAPAARPDCCLDREQHLPDSSVTACMPKGQVPAMQSRFADQTPFIHFSRQILRPRCRVRAGRYCNQSSHLWRSLQSQSCSLGVSFGACFGMEAFQLCCVLLGSIRREFKDWTAQSPESASPPASAVTSSQPPVPTKWCAHARSAWVRSWRGQAMTNSE